MKINYLKNKIHNFFFSFDMSNSKKSNLRLIRKEGKWGTVHPVINHSWQV